MQFPQHLLTIDFETFWSTDFSLSKLSTEEYVRSAEFQAFGAAIKYDDQPSRWFDAAELVGFFAGVPWHDTAVLCHHAQFDGLILAHHYKVRPALWLDTYSMSKMALPRHRHSLKMLAHIMGLPPKGDEVNLTKGLRVLPDHIYSRLKLYATSGTEGHGGDADLTREVFRQLLKVIPASELKVIDLTIRMFTEPRLKLNRLRARNLLAKVIRSKRSALARNKTTREDLSSADKFAKLLWDRFGIVVELKYGKLRADGTHKAIPALAKTDAFMKSLLDHEDPDVQALAALRLEVKSTLEETRIRRLLDMDARGLLCVYLNFAGAHTFRWSGGDKMNWQNFPRGSELRRCIEAYTPPEAANDAAPMQRAA